MPGETASLAEIMIAVLSFVTLAGDQQVVSQQSLLLLYEFYVSFAVVLLHSVCHNAVVIKVVPASHQTCCRTYLTGDLIVQL